MLGLEKTINKLAVTIMAKVEEWYKPVIELLKDIRDTLHRIEEQKDNDESRE